MTDSLILFGRMLLLPTKGEDVFQFNVIRFAFIFNILKSSRTFPFLVNNPHLLLATVAQLACCGLVETSVCYAKM